MNRHKLSHLPLYAFNTKLKILSYTGLIGFINKVELISDELIITIEWENGNISCQPTHALNNVYVIHDNYNGWCDHLKNYGDECLSDAQIEWINNNS